jgi:hypothetical protein
LYQRSFLITKLGQNFQFFSTIPDILVEKYLTLLSMYYFKKESKSHSLSPRLHVSTHLPPIKATHIFLCLMPGFDSLQEQDFSFLSVVQTGSGTHPVSYPMRTGGSLAGDKAAGE